MDFGHERGRLFVAYQDVADRRPRHGIGEPDVLLTRYTEDARDTFVLEAPHEQIGDSPLLFGHVGERTCRPPRESSTSGTRCRLPAPHDRGPRHAGTEADEEHRVARMETPLPDRIHERKRNGR